MRPFFLTALLLAAVVAAEPAHAGDIDASSPESAVLLSVQALRSDDFKAMFAGLPAEDQAKAQEQWKKAQTDTDAQKSADFDQFMAKLLAPDAVDQLMTQAEPQLKAMDPTQISQGLMMASGFLPMMLQQGKDGKQTPMTPDLQRTIAMAQNLLNDASTWVASAGLNDPKKLRDAFEHLVAGAKALGVKDTAELHALSFDDVLGRLGPMCKEVKAALAAYDVQADKFLDSISAKSTGEGDQRTLTVGFTAFGRPYETPIKVEKQGGKWVLAKDAAPAGFDAFKNMIQPNAAGAGAGDGEVK